MVRGADWKWGDQDGGLSRHDGKLCYEGTVRGLRQWHPSDDANTTTSVVVLWDHGLYGNYRFGYKSAFDVKVVGRLEDEKQQDQLLAVGERVQRSQGNWRWGQQDGGAGLLGTVVELYASPAPFMGGCRVAVLWDHERDHFFERATEYMKAHPRGDLEWYADNEEEEDEDEKEEEDEGGNQLSEEQVVQRFGAFENNPHRVRKKRAKYVPPHDDNASDEDSSEWDEPDFEVCYLCCL